MAIRTVPCYTDSILMAAKIPEDDSMKKIRLGSTDLIIEKNGFGALPIQRIPREDAAALLRRAYEGGMNYFDTAYSFHSKNRKKQRTSREEKKKSI